MTTAAQSIARDGGGQETCSHARGFGSSPAVLAALVRALEREKLGWVAAEGFGTLARLAGKDFGWKENATLEEQAKAIAAAKEWLGSKGP